MARLVRKYLRYPRYDCQLSFWIPLELVYFAVLWMDLFFPRLRLVSFPLVCGKLLVISDTVHFGFNVVDHTALLTARPGTASITVTTNT